MLVAEGLNPDGSWWALVDTGCPWLTLVDPGKPWLTLVMAEGLAFEVNAERRTGPWWTMVDTGGPWLTLVDPGGQ